MRLTKSKYYLAIFLDKTSYFLNQLISKQAHGYLLNL